MDLFMWGHQQIPSVLHVKRSIVRINRNLSGIITTC